MVRESVPFVRYLIEGEGTPHGCSDSFPPACSPSPRRDLLGQRPVHVLPQLAVVGWNVSVKGLRKPRAQCIRC